MPDNDNARKDQVENTEQPPAKAGVPLKPAGEVKVTHLDSPPPSGPRTIHPRRPAPIVPERKPEAADDAGKSQEQRQDPKP